MERVCEYVDQRSENPYVVRTYFPHKSQAEVQGRRGTLAFTRQKSERRDQARVVAECHRRQLGSTDSLLCRRQGARPWPPLERRSVAATSWWRIAQAKSTS